MAMYKKEMHLTFEQVSEFIAYDPEAGTFTWLKSPHPRFKAGTEAGRSVKSLRRNTRTGAVSGYKYIGLLGVQTPAARVAWLLTHGKWPEGSLLFRDNDSTNLKLANLKEADFPSIKSVEDGRRKHRMPREQVRKFGLKRYYGMTLETYNVMLAAQNGVCDVCKGTETYQPKTYTGPKALSVDHNHDTGQIRGLLCSNCNYMIGHCKENPEILAAGIAYLKKHATAAPPTSEEIH